MTPGSKIFLAQVAILSIFWNNLQKLFLVMLVHHMDKQVTILASDFLAQWTRELCNFRVLLVWILFFATSFQPHFQTLFLNNFVLWFRFAILHCSSISVT